MRAIHNRVLNIDYNDHHDHDSTVKLLEKWDAYCNLGLYGFALPSAIYRVLKHEAKLHSTTVSEEITGILEAFFADDIALETENATPEHGRTNRIKTHEYASKQLRSVEQVKQYLHQGNRLSGVKIGRDWIIVDDEQFPEDRRKRSASIR